MADTSEQLKNVRTLEDAVNLLMVLFTNLNNQNEMYYDMFLNPVPMDLDLQRYDENGELVTVTLPNVAKMRINVYTGSTNPNGVQTASQGAFYINTDNYDLFYKGYGSDAYGWILIWSERNLDYLSPTGDASRVKNLNMDSARLGTLIVPRGGTGVNSITGIIKGNGEDPFTPAEDGIDYLGPDSMVGIVCYYPIFDSSKANYGIPTGWLRCDGYDGYLKTDYPRLFARLGNTFGGSTLTFGVPNMINRYIKCWNGTSAGSIEQGQVGSHLHSLTGTTDIESGHTHDRGNMEISGYLVSQAYSSAAGGAFRFYSGGPSVMINTTVSVQASAVSDFYASRSWVGRTGTTSHLHTLSGATAYNHTEGTGKNEVDHITMVPIIKY